MRVVRLRMYLMMAVLDTVNDRSRAEEQQCLEEGMRQQVEDACNRRAHANCGDHEAKLRYC